MKGKYQRGKKLSDYMKSKPPKVKKGSGWLLFSTKKDNTFYKARMGVYSNGPDYCHNNN